MLKQPSVRWYLTLVNKASPGDYTKNLFRNPGPVGPAVGACRRCGLFRTSAATGSHRGGTVYPGPTLHRLGSCTSLPVAKMAIDLIFDSGAGMENSLSVIPVLTVVESVMAKDGSSDWTE
jgi:hypothetical protein